MTRRRTASALITLALLAGACGGSDEPKSDPVDPPLPTFAAQSATGSTTIGDAPPDTAASEESTPADEPSESVGFPVTIEHKFGTTTIEERPSRIVSIGFAEHDGLLAIGAEPIAVRDWYGDQPFGTWPWALDDLGDLTPELLPATELNFEQIAALDPDIILGQSSGIDDADYALLTKIAPTIAQSGDHVDYGTPWQEQLEVAGRVLGRSDEAAAVIEHVEQLFADVRAAHPEFAGATAAVAFDYEGMPGAYASSDVRARLLSDLGFVTPPAFDQLSGDRFFFTVSAEQLDVIDTDVIVWLATDDESVEAIRDNPTRGSMRAVAEGRELLADPLLASAFSHASPLSVEFALELLVPELALAIDGDPATAVPSASAIADTEGPAAGASTSLTPDEQVAADAWALVFDSTTSFVDKSKHLADADALRSTVDAYEAAGSTMGGISLVPVAVSIDGTLAVVTYDVRFGTEVAYAGLTGEMTLVDGRWVVQRDEFCSFMASARNACPA